MKDFYARPTQVIFTYFNGETAERNAGIAYCKEIICGCCGGIYILDEVTIQKRLHWEGLSDSISDEFMYGEIYTEKDDDDDEDKEEDDIEYNYVGNI